MKIIKKTARGGKRDGAGRKPTGRIKKSINLSGTKEEEKQLRIYLNKIRNEELFMDKNINLTSPKIHGWEYLIKDVKFDEEDYATFKTLEGKKEIAKSMRDGRYCFKDETRERTFYGVYYPLSYDENEPEEVVEWEFLGLVEDNNCDRC